MCFAYKRRTYKSDRMKFALHFTEMAVSANLLLYLYIYYEKYLMNILSLLIFFTRHYVLHLLVKSAKKARID